MAEIKTITDADGKTMKIINVTNSVGANAVNDFSDVVMVKALLHFSHRYQQIMDITGINYFEIPSPHDGTSYGLAILIKRLQKSLSLKKLLINYKLKVDGRINPINQTAVQGGIYHPMAVLNGLAKLRAAIDGENDHVEYLFRSYKYIYMSDNSFAVLE